jgi:hypothetical protein
LRSIPATFRFSGHYRGVLADEPGGQVVQAVAAGVRDSGVQFRDAGLGRAPPLRGHPSRALVGALTTGRLALQATQLALGDLQVLWVGDDLAGGQHREGLDAEVDTDHGVGLRRRGSWRSTSTENEQNQRPPWCDTVADRMRAVPRSICRASLRVDSWVRTRGDAGQLHMPPVGRGKAERAGGEPARHGRVVCP